MTVKKISITVIFIFMFMIFCSPVSAGVSAEEAARLKSDLTPLGAERAGNADGTIPAWEGGLTGPPAGVTYHPGDRFPDPFKEDKVLFSITSQNMDQYADKLNPGTKAMLKRYSNGYRLDVYKTRRSQATPEWVYENTFKNATRASLTEDRLGLKDAYGGIPFPIPNRGEEVIFNHILRYGGASRIGPYFSGIVNADGTFTAGGGGGDFEQYPYYFKDGSLETFNGDIWYMLNTFSRPARRKGELLLVKDPMDKSKHKRKAWQYLPGQRRVRRAPTIAYDTPNPTYSGLVCYDEGFMFNGEIDRYDWKIVGKQEMYIPYNCYKFHNAAPEEVIQKGYVNPDVIRWELHRVWVLEATLKSGSRHVYAKRVFFIDEDSWIILLKDLYDGRGNLWRTGVGTSWNHYNMPANILLTIIDYDFQKERYALEAFLNYDEKYVITNADKGIDKKYFETEYLRKLGRR